MANALQSRFERTGSQKDLDYAISIIEEAVELTPNDYPDRVMYLNNLAIALHRRSERIGSMEDLDREIITIEQGIQLISNDHPSRSICFLSLGNALRSRFDRTGSIDELDRAISTFEQAIELTSNDRPDFIAQLTSIGIALRRRFERTGSMEDLDRAISNCEKATELASNGPYQAICLNNLGNSLRRRFDRTGSMRDLDRSISTFEQAVELTSNDHTDRAGRLDNLGTVLQGRFERMGSMKDLDRAIRAKQEALESETAPISIRLDAGESCSSLLITQRRYSHAKDILQAAVRLLPRVSPRQLNRKDAQFNISQFANITCRAVSLFLQNGDEQFKSLQLLELGRGILASLQLEVRSDISVLAASHPDLAKQFQELRDQIDSSSQDLAPWDSLAPELSLKNISERRVLLERFDDILHCIRTLQGFENFLQGPLESELCSLAEDGAIVVFNVSDIRSDAFIISTDGIRSLHLPSFTQKSLETFVKHFLDAINEHDRTRYRHARRTMNGVLAGLWDCAVKPVLAELGFTCMPPPGKQWPRVWWVASGLLSILPIHASGYHDSDPRQSALDCVISSYAPTVKSLAYAREKASIAAQNVLEEKALLVAMPTTPDRQSLQFVDLEIKEIENLFAKSSIKTRVMYNSTRAEVLSELPQHSIVHFACHGYPADDPSLSSLLLQDWKDAPLTVSDLAAINVGSVRLAYLSACQTSTMRDFRLLDESISLSSAFQLSGYPSVVGSLWQITDSHSAEIARDLYKWILQDELDVRRTAEGLHKAVRDLRERSRYITRTDPLVWASFVHVGV